MKPKFPECSRIQKKAKLSYPRVPVPKPSKAMKDKRKLTRAAKKIVLKKRPIGIEDCWD